MCFSKGPYIVYTVVYIATLMLEIHHQTHLVADMSSLYLMGKAWVLKKFTAHKATPIKVWLAPNKPSCVVMKKNKEDAICKLVLDLLGDVYANCL